MTVRVYFDTTEVSCPLNWQDIESSMKYDDQLNAILLTEETTLDFDGTAYQYLSDSAEEGFCGSIDLRIAIEVSTTETQEIINGLLFVSDVTFQERKGIASVKIRDKSYYSRINNNKSIEFLPTTNRTKNFEVMTAATVYNLDVYDLDNTLLRSNVESFRIYEVLRTCIAFMSDNTVSFASTLFDIGGAFEGLCITNGYRLRTGSTNALRTTNFTEIIDELRSVAPIQMTVENPTTSPVLRVELESYFQDTDDVIEINDVYEITRRFAVEKLYSTIKVGADVIDSDVTLSFPETIKYVGFNAEDYYVLGKCNIDNTLEITGGWLRTSNLIERTAINGSKSADDEIFLIDSTLTDASNGRTKNSNFLSLNPPLYYYNETLTNQSIFDRYVGKIPADIAQSGNVGDGLFKAYRATTIPFGTGAFAAPAVDYTNVAYNTASYFDGTDRYTAIYSGVYDFELNTDVTLATFSAGSLSRTQLSVVLVHLDSTGTQIDTLTVSNYATFAAGSYKLFNTKRVVMNAGDQLEVWFTKIDSFGHTSTGQIEVTSYWKCIGNTVGAGVFKDYDYLDFPINLYEFDYPLTQTQWQDIVNSPVKRIVFTDGIGKKRFGYINNVTRNHITGMTSFKLINTYRQNAS